MQCIKCGLELQPGSTICSRCGASRLPVPTAFLIVEKRFSNLRAQFQKGVIDFPAYQEACQGLTLKDAAGDAWRFNISDREWYRWDKGQWVRQDPAPASLILPVQQPVRQASVPVSPSRSISKPRQKPGKRRWWVIGCGATILLGVVGIIILGTSGVLTGFIQLPGVSLPGGIKPGNDAGVDETPQSVSDMEGDELGQQFTDSTQPGAEGKTSTTGYCIVINKPGTVFFESSQLPAAYLAIESSVVLKDGAESSEYGVIVRANDQVGTGGIALTINGMGQWRVQSLAEGGAVSELHSWSDSTALAPGVGTNRLSVLVEGESLYFLANGEILWERQDLAAGGEVWGLYANSASATSSEVCFTSLLVEALNTAPTDDRQLFLTKFGSPDTFVLLIENIEDGSLVRREEWVYYDELTALTFLDGLLVNDEVIEASQELLYSPTHRYNPLDFQAGMSIAQVKSLLSGMELAEMEVLPELGGDYRLFGAEQIMLGFSDGKLVYVETLSLTAAEEVTP